KDLPGSSNDSKRQADICRARHSRQIAFRFGVARRLIDFAVNWPREPLRKVFLPLCLGPGLIRNFPALDDAHAGGFGANRAKSCRERGGARGMGFDVRVRAVESLPDP